MRPVRLTMEGFASFRTRTELDFTDADYFALVGPTGSGKSTVIDAITFALYGTVYRWRDSKAIANALAPTSNRGFVSLIFDSGGQRYQVVREVRRTTGKNAGVKTSNVALHRYLDSTAMPPSSLTPATPSTETGAGGVNGANGTNGTGGEVVVIGTDNAPPDAENLLGDSTDVRSLTRSIVDIIGLSLQDFNQCVVLPQGDFAQFLHASRTERQTILLKLLDVGHNERIRLAASQRASTARTQADTLAVERDKLGDGSEAAEQLALADQARLSDLHAALTAQTGAWEDLLDARADAANEVRDLEVSLAALAALRTPANVAELASRHAAATTERDARRDAATLSAEALSEATGAASEGPDRARVEHLLTDRRRQGALTEARPGLAEIARRAVAELEAATGRTVADRGAHTEATEELEEATEALRGTAATLTEQRTVLGRLTLTAPPGLDQLATDLAGARTAHTEATDRLAAAEAAHTAAHTVTADLDAAGLDPRTLGTARARLDEAAEALLALPGAAEQVEAATAGHTRAEVAFTEARGAHARAVEMLDEARRVDTGATLRATLQVGNDCPVCTQQVATLPPPAPAGEQDAAAEAKAAAENALEAARKARDTASLAAQSAVGGLRSALAHGARCASSAHHAAPTTLGDHLDTSPENTTEGTEGTSGGYDADRGALGRLVDLLGQGTSGGDGDAVVADAAQSASVCRHLGAHLDAAAAAAASHQQAEERTRRDVTTRRKSEESARHVLEEVRKAQEQANTDLAQAAGALADLGAPSAAALLSGDDLAAGWADLLGWVEQQSTDLRTGALADAQASHDTAQARVEGARQTHRSATTALAGAESAEQAATLAADRAEGDLARSTTELGALNERLAGAPGVEELQVDLAECERLAAAVRSATAAARQTSTAAKAAEAAYAKVAAETVAADAELRQARDSVSALHPPDLHGGAGADLGAQWATLTGWAATTAAELIVTRDAAADRCRQHQEALGARAEEITALLATHDLTLTSAQVDADRNLARTAAGVAALAVQRAEGAVERVLAIRARTAELAKEIAQAEERATVAGALADLMRSNKFSQWLADSVLDQLVATAADSLRTLSNGQFSLAHRGGEFYVRDHNDANELRSVRTLSGGETFQTSLALALALSEQLAELGTGGTGRLESIFLDEGFGTLDPEALETVAVTLESLSQGHRMVGVVTHVPALAERIPVRFRVRRTDNVSHIEVDNT